MGFVNLGAFRGKQLHHESTVSAALPSTGTQRNGTAVGKEDLKPRDLSRRLPELGFSSHRSTTEEMVKS